MKTLMMTAAVLAGIVINVANAAPLPEAKPDDVGFSQQGLTRLDEFFAREIAAKRVPGAVVAIARDGKLVHYKAYGQLDATKGTPMPLDAIFALASMTKPMAAVAGTAAEINSITLSNPNANSTRLPDTMLEPIATTASITIQPIVIHSSRNASRTSGWRSTVGLEDSINGGGVQHSSSQRSATLSTCSMSNRPSQSQLHHCHTYRRSTQRQGHQLRPKASAARIEIKTVRASVQRRLKPVLGRHCIRD
jgi:hypothetical protein